MKSVIILMIVLFIYGCTNSSALYVGPAGKTLRCSSHGWGYIGAPMAKMSFNRCEEDVEKMGFLPIESAGMTGIVMQENAGESVIIGRTLDGSPAAEAGIKSGDVIVSVNGKKPAGRADALQLMFGKKGGFVTLILRREDVEQEVRLMRAPYRVDKDRNNRKNVSD